MQEPILSRQNVSVSQVVGPLRANQFTRPILPIQNNEIPREVDIDLPKDNQSDHLEVQQEAEPAARTVDIQTDFRENEAQTDPFSRDQLKKGNDPEVLRIKNLVWGQGLPATNVEIELIELTREKRAFEQALPPTSDEGNFSIRRLLMDQQETLEWKRRDNEIRKLENERIELIKNVLYKRDEEREEAMNERIEQVRKAKNEAKDRKVAQTQKNRIKEIRKAFNSRALEENKIKKPTRNIVEEQSNFGSQVQAPVTRKGMSLDKLGNRQEIQPDCLQSQNGIEDLQQSINRGMHFEFKLNSEDLRGLVDHAATREDLKKRAVLRVADDQLKDKTEKDKKGKEEDSKENLNDNATGKDILVARQDRSLQDKHQDAGEKIRAIALLQRLIKGRNEQNKMYEGREKRRDLIKELKASEEVKRDADRDTATIVEEYQNKIVSEFNDGLKGKVISKALDNLSKEIIRWKQEKKIAAMVKVAERERRIREAEESGRRQAEEILRRREDQIFKETMAITQGTVDSWLLGVINETVDVTAQEQSTIEVSLRSQQVNKIIDDLEYKNNKPQMVIKDLLHSYMLPQVKREISKRAQEQDHKKFGSGVRKVMTTLGERFNKEMGRNEKKFENNSALRE